MDTILKNKIIKLRRENKTYDEIKNLLGCSKATISYHCKKYDLGDSRLKVDDHLKNEINEYYKAHTIDEVVNQFNISRSTVIKYVENKRIELTDDELRLKNYVRVKTYRQKIKERAVEYKGSKCVKCGYDKCIRALEFHHIDPNQKDFHLSAYKVLSWDKIKIELDKCILVCSNCHKEIHFEIDNNTDRVIGSSPIISTINT